MFLPDPWSIFTLTPKNSSPCCLTASVSIVLSLTAEIQILLIEQQLSLEWWILTQWYYRQRNQVNRMR